MERDKLEKNNKGPKILPILSKLNATQSRLWHMSKMSNLTFVSSEQWLMGELLWI